MTTGTNHFLSSLSQPEPLCAQLLEMPGGGVAVSKFHRTVQAVD